MTQILEIAHAFSCVFQPCAQKDIFGGMRVGKKDVHSSMLSLIEVNVITYILTLCTYLIALLR